MKNSDDDYDEERRTNLSACVAALSFEEGRCPEKVDSSHDEATYELMYNKATTLTALGEYQKALTLLKKSEGNRTSGDCRSLMTLREIYIFVQVLVLCTKVFEMNLVSCVRLQMFAGKR